MAPSAEAQALFAHYRRAFVALPPAGSGEVALHLAAGDVVRLVSYDRHVSTTVRAVEGAPTHAACIVLPTGFAPDGVTVAPGPARLRLENGCGGPVGVLVLDGDARAQQEVVETHRATLRPYVTGRMLLNTQSFRELFRLPSRDPGLALRMRHLTVLFSDLSNSTWLYDQLGDATAYELVRQHLRALVQTTRRHDGAVIKTIGDAVMATFSSPLDGVRAAIEMQRAVDALDWSPTSDRDRLGLKIGLHAGPALLVNAEDRLDYFGHTVNVAARVQGLAGARRICLTQAVLDAPGVRAVLATEAASTASDVVAIRGVVEPVAVYQIAVRQGTKRQS